MGIVKPDRNAPSSTGPVAWEDAPTEFTSRSGVVIEIWGPTGSGRTTLALTSPGPIAIIQFHEKIKGVVEDFAKVKPVKIFKAGGVFRGEPEQIQVEAWDKMLEMEAAYYDSFKWAKTRIVDTYIEAWELERLAEFGAPKPTKGQVRDNYGPVNNRWRSMINKARQAADDDDQNTIFIGTTDDEWRENAKGFSTKTGRQIRVSNTAAAQVALKSNVRIEISKESGGDNGPTFSGTIIKGWFNAESEDMVLLNRDLNYPMLMGLVTGTNPKEWE